MYRLVVPLFLILTLIQAQAELRLPNVFSDHLVLQRDKPISVWGWADPSEAVSVTLAEATVETTANAEGKWMVQLPAQPANDKPQTLTVKGASKQIQLSDLLVGEVWLCSGQSNMEWSMTNTEKGKEEIPKADHPLIRLYDVQGHIQNKEPQEDAPGEWKACSPESVAKFSAVGYYFGKNLQAEIKVPIGLIGSNWGGTQIEPWTPKVGLEQVESLKNNAVNGGIYNGMIHPLVPYSLRGIIWYQGESNCLKGDTTIYTDRTLALVKGWRTVFKQDDLPFYFVEIAPFIYAAKFKERNPNLNEESLPRFWDAQAACLTEVPNCGMVVVSDITGDVTDIHPRNKRDVGYRLALWALAKNYGKKDLVYSGPFYQSMKVNGGKVEVSFDHLGSGLETLDGQPLAQFEIAGGDKQFVPATAEIQGDVVVVSADQVKQPVAVRYAWHESAIGNLANQEGLPAAPFRTDEW